MSIHSEGELQIYPGKGDGTFGAPSIIILPGQNVLSIAAVDVNGNGIPDLVVASDEEGGVQIFLGKGDGTFTTPVLTVNAGAASVASGGFNGDGKLDMAVASGGATSVSVALGQGRWHVCQRYFERAA